MGAIVDPDLLSRLNVSDPTAPMIPGQANPTPAPSGPVTDPALLSRLNSAPDEPPPAPPAQQPSTAADMAQSAGSGLVKGTVGIVTGPIGLAHSAAQGAVHGLDYLGRKALGLPDLTPDQIAQRNSDVDRIDQNIDGWGPAQVAQNADQTVAAHSYQPQTPAGQMTSNIASFLPQAAVTPGSMARNLVAYGLAPGVASEAAGQAGTAMLGDGADPWARAAGALVGGIGGHLGVAPVPADHILSGATRGVSDADMTDAHALQQRAQAQGINITPAEAVQQVTNGRSNLGNVQRHLEGMGESAPIMADYFAQRPQQVQNAASNVFGQISPYPTDPSQVAVAAQKEATGALGDIRQDRTNATSKYYAAAADDHVPQSRMAMMAQQLDGMVAQHPNNPELTRGLMDLRSQIVDQPGSSGTPAVPGQRTPVTDPTTGAVIRYQQQPGTPEVPATPETYLTKVPQLDEIYGGLRDQYTGSPPLGQSGTDARAGRIAGQGIGLLNDALKESSPMLAAGRQAHGIMSDRWVAPREAGPLGQISETNDLQAQGNALYPSNPNVGSQGETTEAVERMPNTAPAITRNHLETRFNEATQDNMGGPNQWGGAKFAAQAFGNDQQATNLRAGIAALPNGDAVTPKMNDLVQALQATGQRQQIGSKTAYNAHLNTTLEAGSPLGNALSLATSPTKALEFARDWYQQRRIGTNSEMMAHALTGEGGFDRLAAARAAVPPEQYRSLVAQALMGKSAAPVIPALRNRTQDP